jgi:hypothetical protein
MLIHTARKIAEFKDMTLDASVDAVTMTSRNFFGLK